MCSISWFSKPYESIQILIQNYVELKDPILNEKVAEIHSLYMKSMY